jgi:hypothetical protein
MTKRSILVAICENPGWQPQQPVGQQVETFLNQLLDEGWITPRLDGWEATPQAIDEYPQFATQLDIADPEATMRGVPATGSTQVAGLAQPEEPPSEQVVAVVTLDGLGYQVRLNRETGKYNTVHVGHGGSGAFGHYESIRLLAELSRLLGAVI